MSTGEHYVLAVTGLAFEARIAESAGAVRACCGSEALNTAALDAAIKPGCRGIVSFGVAGGLDPQLQPGTMVVATHVLTHSGTVATHPGWCRRLLKDSPCIHAPIFSAEAPLASPEHKRLAHARTGAAAVDMESGMAAELAQRYALPFAVLRAIADPVTRSLPACAAAGVRPDGSVDTAKICASLLRRPNQIFGLWLLAGDTRKARGILRAAARRLGPGLGLFDLD